MSGVGWRCHTVNQRTTHLNLPVQTKHHPFSKLTKVVLETHPVTQTLLTCARIRVIGKNRLLNLSNWNSTIFRTLLRPIADNQEVIKVRGEMSYPCNQVSRMQMGLRESGMNLFFKYSKDPIITSRNGPISGTISHPDSVFGPLQGSLLNNLKFLSRI